MPDTLHNALRFTRNPGVDLTPAVAGPAIYVFGPVESSRSSVDFPDPVEIIYIRATRPTIRVVSPVLDPLTGRPGYFELVADPSELTDAVLEVLVANRRYELGFFDDALALNGARDVYPTTEDYCIVEEDRLPKSTRPEASYSVVSPRYKKDSRARSCLPSNDYITETASAITTVAKQVKKLKQRFGFTMRQRKELAVDLPQKLTHKYTRENPEIMPMIDKLLRDYESDVMSTIKQLSRTDPGFAKRFFSELLSSQCEYNLVVRRKRPEEKSLYDNNLQYYLFLEDSKGRQTMVAFRNTASFCMYILHVIDRYRRRGNTTELDMLEMRDSFSRLYDLLFFATPEKIDSVYRKFDRYESESNPGKMRSGRYNEYLDDIEKTIVRLAGDVESRPLKIGLGRPLTLAPSQIKLPEELASFEIREL